MKKRIGINKVEDIISRGSQGGKIGLSTDRFKQSQKLPGTAKQQDFPSTYNLRSKRAKFDLKGSILSRQKYEQTKFKEEQVNMSGLESSKIDNAEFQGKKPLIYNPFAMNAGAVSQFSGYNAGGSEEFSNVKSVVELLPTDYKLSGKKNDGLRVVLNPEKENPVVRPGGRVKVLVKIK